MQSLTRNLKDYLLGGPKLTGPKLGNSKPGSPNNEKLDVKRDPDRGRKVRL